MNITSSKAGIYKPLAVFLVSIFLLLSSFAVKEVSIVSTICALSCSIVLLFSLSIVSSAYIAKPYEKLLMILFVALFLYASPHSIIYHPIYIASILSIWTHFFLIRNKVFIAFLLLTIASLIFPPLVWSLPILIVSQLIQPDRELLKVLIKEIGGILLPVIFLFSYLYICDMPKDEIVSLIDKFKMSLFDISHPLRTSKISYFFFLIIIVIVSIRAIYILNKQAHRSSNEVVYIYYNQIIYLVLIFLLFVFFSGNSSYPVSILIAPPLGIILAHFFFLRISYRETTIELSLILITLIVVRLSYFIN